MYFLCEHENVAVHMAGGYALATGKGQAVLVHVDAGTANSVMAMHNLFRTRLPGLLLAGRAPYSFEKEIKGSRDAYVHFVQDPFDIASLVRPYTKWEYDLPSGLLSKEAVRRAHAMMQSDPAGPVYMTLARETLAAEFDESEFTSFSRQRRSPVMSGGVDASRAEHIATAILSAENPIAFTAYLGRKPEAMVAFDALTRECGIAVAEYNPSYLNIPRDSPCFTGFNPEALMESADLGLLLDVDVPFVPKAAPRAEDICWLQVDTDPLKKDIAMWGFSTDFGVQADCAVVLNQVLEIIRVKADDGFHARVAGRMAKLEAALGKRLARIASAGSHRGGIDAISSDYVCATLGRKLALEDIIVNEAIRNSVPVLEQIPRSLAGTYFANGGGGLGFSGGVALGLKLAKPGRRVVQIVGDGSFHFCNPDTVCAVAQRYSLPIFTIVFDNGGWKAVKDSVVQVYPDGAAARTDRYYAKLADAGNSVRQFDRVAQAFDAYGEYVRDPEHVEDAIDRCLTALDEGRSAVLHVQANKF